MPDAWLASVLPVAIAYAELPGSASERANSVDMVVR